MLGAAVLVGCFLSGISFSYRCIFLLLVAPWLWEQRTRRSDARLAVWLTTGVLWFDGISCLVMNFLVGPVSQTTSSAFQLAWRVTTQPLVWILIVLLIRWLLEIAVAAWRAPREAAGAAQPA